MKLKMMQPGFAGHYTGVFGRFEFVDGVSVDDVNADDARRLASLTSLVWLETDEDPGVNATYQVSLHKEATSVNYLTVAQEMALAAENPEQAPTEVASEVQSTVYTKEQLEQVADAEGIAGLRKIGDLFNVKSSSVSKLINAILTAQGSSVSTPAEE